MPNFANTFSHIFQMVATHHFSDNGRRHLRKDIDGLVFI